MPVFDKEKFHARSDSEVAAEFFRRHGERLKTKNVSQLARRAERKLAKVLGEVVKELAR